MCRAIEELVEQQKLEEKKETIMASIAEGLPIETIAKVVRLSVDEVKAIIEPAMV